MRVIGNLLFVAFLFCVLYITLVPGSMWPAMLREWVTPLDLRLSNQEWATIVSLIFVFMAILVLVIFVPKRRRKLALAVPPPSTTVQIELGDISSFYEAADSQLRSLEKNLAYMERFVADPRIKQTLPELRARQARVEERLLQLQQERGTAQLAELQSSREQIKAQLEELESGSNGSLEDQAEELRRFYADATDRLQKIVLAADNLERLYKGLHVLAEQLAPYLDKESGAAALLERANKLKDNLNDQLEEFEGGDDLADQVSNLRDNIQNLRTRADEFMNQLPPLKKLARDVSQLAASLGGTSEEVGA